VNKDGGDDTSFTARAHRGPSLVLVIPLIEPRNPTGSRLAGEMSVTARPAHAGTDDHRRESCCRFRPLRLLEPVRRLLRPTARAAASAAMGAKQKQRKQAVNPVGAIGLRPEEL
jgi:hypothetical protein